MPQSLSWSFTASSPIGVGVNAFGTAQAEAITAAGVTLDANMAAAQDLALQIDAVDKVRFLILTSSLNDGTVELKADSATVTKLTGPLVLFGNAVELFAGDLDTLSVQNKSTDTPAEISILIGLALG